MRRRLFHSLRDPLVDERTWLQHQLHLLHAELVREDARKREAIRAELRMRDALQAFLRNARLHLDAA